MTTIEKAAEEIQRGPFGGRSIDRSKAIADILTRHFGEAVKDSVRLDTLENADMIYHVAIQIQPSGDYIWGGHGKGLRAAIDAAIAGKEAE